MNDVKGAIDKIPGGIETKAGVVVTVGAILYQVATAYQPLFGISLTFPMIITAAGLGALTYFGVGIAMTAFNLVKDGLFGRILKKEETVRDKKLLGLENLDKQKIINKNSDKKLIKSLKMTKNIKSIK